MIEFANDRTAPLVRSMWKTCFGDTDSFMDLYFAHKYKNENTLVYFEEGKAVASLQMSPYKIRFYGEIVPFYYLAGLCTLPEFRNKGYMGSLIKKACRIMQDRLIPLSILIPAEDWLYGYYAKYGFETTFKKGKQPIELKQILDKNQYNIEKAYLDFDIEYQNRDFCVLKSMQDFKCIVQDNIQENFPLKSNLSGMSALIDPEFLLKLYAKKHPQNRFILKIHDQSLDNYIIYSINNGSVEKLSIDSDVTFEVSSQMLARLLFGFKTNLLSVKYSSLFETHTPIMNLMLE